MADRTIEALLKISTKLGSMHALKTLQNELRKVDTQAKAFNRTQTLMGRLQANFAAAAASPIARFVAPGVLGYAGVNLVKDFAGVERSLTRTGLKIGATREEMRALRSDSRDVARDLALPADTMLTLVDSYAETGAGLKEITADMRGLAEATQALGADGRDVVNVWDGMRKSFGLTTRDQKRAFGSIAAGGAAGKFEASDMAQFFPSLLPVAAGFGMKGIEGIDQLVAFAEVQRDFVGTSSEAATAIGDFLEKVNSPTVQKAFRNFGIDLEKRMKAARDNGEDMLEFMHQIIMEATKGDPTQLTKLFGDKEARRAARVILEHMDRIRRAQAEIERNAPEVIDRNNKEILQDTQAALDRIIESGKRAGEALAQGAVDSGLADWLDTTAKESGKAQAINKALTKEGYGTGGRFLWWLWNSIPGSGQARNLKAMDGGYKIPGLPDLTYPTDAPQVDRPDVPIPMARPARPGEAGYVAPPAPVSSTWRGENSFEGASREEQLREAAAANARDLGFALEDGGAKAGDAIQTGMEQGGNAVSDALRKAGDYIAARILNAVSSIQVNVGGSPGAAGRPSGDHGESGGDIMAVP